MPLHIFHWFQDSSSPLMEQLLFFHDHVMLILIMISSLVLYFFIFLLSNNFTNRFMVINHTLEATWTSLPAIMLILVALPSLHLLYMIDEVMKPAITIKAIAHQWYWTYEYSDFNHISFDSYMMNSSDDTPIFRLLNVSSRTVLPTNTQIRMLVTSTDVIHSWAIPSLGCKVDAIPGRLNQISFMISRLGIMFGQCSEICGANHSFMPIVIEAVPLPDFIKWLETK